MNLLDAKTKYFTLFQEETRPKFWMEKENKEKQQTKTKKKKGPEKFVGRMFPVEVLKKWRAKNWKTNKDVKAA